MNKIKLLLLLNLFIFLTPGWSQHSDPTTFKTDSIFSLAGKFKRSRISLGTDTLFEFKETDGKRNLNAKNIRTIEKVRINNNKYYKVTTQNIPANSNNITIVSALLDYTDLHILTMQLAAKTDSGFIEFKQHRFSGWSQLPNEERKIIDLPYKGYPLLADAGTPWVAGLLFLKENRKIVIPYFALFANVVRWKTYIMLGNETITINEKKYVCRKVNAGPVGPPGYISYQWYEHKTGKLIKSELIKEGVPIRYVSELQQ